VADAAHSSNVPPVQSRGSALVSAPGQAPERPRMVRELPFQSRVARRPQIELRSWSTFAPAWLHRARLNTDRERGQTPPASWAPGSGRCGCTSRGPSPLNASGQGMGAPASIRRNTRVELNGIQRISAWAPGLQGHTPPRAGSGLPGIGRAVQPSTALSARLIETG